MKTDTRKVMTSVTIVLGSHTASLTSAHPKPCPQPRICSSSPILLIDLVLSLLYSFVDLEWSCFSFLLTSGKQNYSISVLPEIVSLLKYVTHFILLEHMLFLYCKLIFNCVKASYIKISRQNSSYKFGPLMHLFKLALPLWQSALPLRDGIEVFIFYLSFEVSLVNLTNLYLLLTWNKTLPNTKRVELFFLPLYPWPKIVNISRKMNIFGSIISFHTWILLCIFGMKF